MRAEFGVFDGVGTVFFAVTVAAAGLLVCATAAAQAPSSVTESDFLGDMPIVLSVSRLPQRLDETPGAVTIVDREMIRLSGARDVADLLRLVPGFQVSNSYQSVAPLVSYHGAFDSYSNRIELLIDGRSAYSPFFIGSVGPGLLTVALQDIERIEVLRGSNSAAYGARAVLGVINIVTRDTADTLGVQASTAFGENGIRDVQARLGWGEWGASSRLTVESHADDGLAGANGSNHESRVNFRTDLRPNASNEIQLRLGALQVGAGRGLHNDIDNPWRDYSFDSNYAQLDWKRNLGEDSDLAFKLSHSQESYQDQFAYALQNISAKFFTPSDIYIVNAGGKASSDAVSLQYTRRQSQTVRTVVGGEFRSESVQSRGLYNTDRAFVTDFTRLFGNLEWRVAPDWLVNAGALAEHNSVSGDKLSPRLMLNWHLAPGQTLRAGASEAFRPPSTYENHAYVRYNWIDPVKPYGFDRSIDQTSVRSTGNLLSELVHSREIGYLGDFPQAGLSLDVRIFDEHISNFIRLQDKSSPKNYVNDEDFSINGVEYQLKWQPWQGARFIVNQAYTDINSINLGTALAAPQLATSLAYFQKLPGQIDLTLMHTDNRTAVQAGSSNKDALPMTRTDLRLSKGLRWGTHRGEIALVVQNLGSPYSDYKPAFLFQRQAFVTLRLEE